MTRERATLGGVNHSVEHERLRKQRRHARQHFMPSKKDSPSSQIQRERNDGLFTSFDFRKRHDRIDWRTLAGIDVIRIIRDIDLNTLQGIIENITFSDIELEGYQDRNFVKLFQLSQLIIEYLLHCQSELLVENEELKDMAEEADLQYQAQKALHDQLIQERNDLKKEVKSLKKTVYAYQLASKVPGGIGQNGMMKSAVYWRCRICPKVFATEAFLTGHEQRRHPEIVRDDPGAATPKASESPTDFKKIADMLKLIVGSGKSSQKSEEDGHAIRAMKELEKKKIDMETQYEQYRLKYEEELQRMKADLARQLQEERNLLDEERKGLMRLVESSTKGKHIIGTLEDDDNESIRNKSPVKPSTPVPKDDEMKNILREELAQLKSSLFTTAENDKKNMEEKLSVALNEVYNLKQKLLQNTALGHSPVEIVSKVEIDASVETIDLEPVHRVSRVSTSVPSQWSQILEALTRHTKTDIAEKPWLKSYICHKQADVLDETQRFSQFTDEKMKDLFGSKDVFTMLWKSNPEMGQEKLGRAKQQLYNERSRLSETKPFFVQMRDYLEKQMNEVVAKHSSIQSLQSHESTELARFELVDTKSLPEQRLPTQVPTISTEIANIASQKRRASIATSIPESALTIATSYVGSPESSFQISSPLSSLQNSPSAPSTLSSRKLSFANVAATKLTFQNALRKVSGNITKRLFFRSPSKSQELREPKDINASLPPLPTTDPAPQEQDYDDDEEETPSGEFTHTSESPSRSIVSAEEWGYSRSASPEMTQAMYQTPEPQAPRIKELREEGQDLTQQHDGQNDVSELIYMREKNQGWTANVRQPPPKPPSVPSLQRMNATEEDGSFSVSELSNESASSSHQEDTPKQEVNSAESSDIDFGEFALSQDENIQLLSSAPQIQRIAGDEPEDLTDLLDDLDASSEESTNANVVKNTIHDEYPIRQRNDTPVMDDIEDFDFDD